MAELNADSGQGKRPTVNSYEELPGKGYFSKVVHCSTNDSLIEQELGYACPADAAVQTSFPIFEGKN